MLAVLDDGSDLRQEFFDALFGWLDEQLTVVLAHVLAQEVKALFDVRQPGLFRRQTQASCGQKVYHSGIASGCAFLSGCAPSAIQN